MCRASVLVSVSPYCGGMAGSKLVKSLHRSHLYETQAPAAVPWEELAGSFVVTFVVNRVNDYVGGVTACVLS